MKLDMGLNLKQVQKLLMTPQLKQAIEILQLNSYELNELITSELETNPMLEAYEDKEDIIEIYRELNKNSDLDKYNYSADDEERDDLSFENMVSTDTSLTDHLLFQLHITPLAKKIKEICKVIIYDLDSNGYLNDDVKKLSEDYNYSQEDVLAALNVVQSFDPPGIAARNLTECLMIQLKSKNMYDGVIKEIVENYLEEIADNKLSFIAKKLNVDIKEVQNAVDEIKKLNPRPGSSFSSYNDIKYVVPDAYIKKIDGDYVVLINESLYPGLRINKSYESILTATDDDNTKKYLSNKIQSAMWLIKSIESRRDTLYKVLSAIVKEQRSFFDREQKYIKPMNLKKIAEAVGVHESTVSRAVNGKYVDTPLGVFEIKYFFQSGIGNGDGEMFSQEMIKEMIKQLISEEDPQDTLSDQKIAEILSQKGVTISRRTVAKYREEMNIPSSSKRKRY
ncbi:MULTISPECIES: RNA polymerase factor sigma-54 [Thermoanaerobacterium]|uniref:RNA polymerase sigma 54 subunit RpoN n=2 Tax=Thermoanaerobacterium TaxID=28895 RepID=W9E9I6_9THEO|nr:MULTISPECIES: RNA polymerase factor sigma-54 [Thermoanaerobacterium]AFK87486.1 RNA polymerase, sigma 54 subunit, RpoN [Thermoanaerobacterium saccharolyticum JW/SL-YS485]ETO37736.1 RNA polymerase sigma 54 subunit RpoN [Thermoanaerobacterium aotearoense SCUT27]